MSTTDSRIYRGWTVRNDDEGGWVSYWATKDEAGAEMMRLALLSPGVSYSIKRTTISIPGRD